MAHIPPLAWFRKRYRRSRKRKKMKKRSRRRHKSTPIMRRTHHATFAHLIHDALLRLNKGKRTHFRAHNKTAIANNISSYYMMKLGRKFLIRLDMSLRRLVRERKLSAQGNFLIGTVYKPSQEFVNQYARLKVTKGYANRRFGVGIERGRKKTGSKGRGKHGRKKGKHLTKIFKRLLKKRRQKGHKHSDKLKGKSKQLSKRLERAVARSLSKKKSKTKHRPYRIRKFKAKRLVAFILKRRRRKKKKRRKSRKKKKKRRRTWRQLVRRVTRLGKRRRHAKKGGTHKSSKRKRGRSRGSHGKSEASSGLTRAGNNLTSLYPLRGSAAVTTNHDGNSSEADSDIRCVDLLSLKAQHEIDQLGRLDATVSSSSDSERNSEDMLVESIDGIESEVYKEESDTLELNFDMPSRQSSRSRDSQGQNLPGEQDEDAAGKSMHCRSPRFKSTSPLSIPSASPASSSRPRSRSGECQHGESSEIG